MRWLLLYIVEWFTVGSWYHPKFYLIYIIFIILKWWSEITAWILLLNWLSLSFKLQNIENLQLMQLQYCLCWSCLFWSQLLLQLLATPSQLSSSTHDSKEMQKKCSWKFDMKHGSWWLVDQNIKVKENTLQNRITAIDTLTLQYLWS